MKLEKANVL